MLDVHAAHPVAAPLQIRHQVMADETAGAGHQHASSLVHVLVLLEGTERPLAASQDVAMLQTAGMVTPPAAAAAARAGRLAATSGGADPQVVGHLRQRRLVEHAPAVDDDRATSARPLQVRRADGLVFGRRRTQQQDVGAADAIRDRRGEMDGPGRARPALPPCAHGSYTATATPRVANRAATSTP